MNKFNIIVPVYNSEKWIGGCIESILSQDYLNYDVLVINDCSTDDTWGVIKEYPVFAITNRKRLGALENIVRGIKLIGEDIIVTVDGDDRLADDKVLSHLDSLYTNDVWMTYGSFLPVSGKYKNTCQAFDKMRVPCEEGWLVDAQTTPAEYRRSGYWVTSHLRTFRKSLWDRIEDKDLRGDDGQYFKVAWDLAFMYPMIEMADGHVRFIDKILYLYNDLNPICDGTINTSEQLRITELIQNRKQYAKIDGNIL